MDVRAILGGIAIACFSSAIADNAQFTAEMDSQVSSSQFDDFTIMAGDDSGILYEKSKGNYDVDRREVIASASKLVSAVVLMDLVESNVLSLDSKPSDFIAHWETANAGMETITLRHLLSFTSGLVGNKCASRRFVKFERCTKRIFKAGLGAQPGSTYDYHSSHMQVAALMATRSLSLSSWNDVFERFKEKHSLFADEDVYTNLRGRSRRNPLLAAGLHTTPRNYAAFLSALVGGRIVDTDSMDVIFSNHTRGLEFDRSPIQSGLGEHWDYGLGVWIECEQSGETVPDCNEPLRYSSAGAFGFYPWISVDRSYFALIARKGRIIGPGDRSDVVGIKNGREFQPIVDRHFGYR